ncbi:hypothetical protein BDA96_10G215300 [Sorghum bicolor]|uniref:Uncharacterized protein n=1 Tax=Sorghum bicolor TaxID=4558 RepID=A0A921Q5W7_SORBI|nr:hypothetical protein BDA96_10G215300 [Sorghum bicolor]
MHLREPGSGLMLTQEELQKYNTLRSSSFRCTSIIDPVLLDHTGMSAEFNAVFNTIGWGGFWMVPELGIEKNDFWKAISGSNDCSNLTPHQIHNLTLGNILSDEELKLLYAMVCKIKVSPVKLLVDYWLNSIEYGKPVYFTSFITRIAESTDALEPHTFEYITSARDVLNEDVFININVLKRGPSFGLKMVYSGYTVEVPLPCEKCQLYALRTLTIKLDKESRSQNIVGPRQMTRGMSQAA